MRTALTWSLLGLLAIGASAQHRGVVKFSSGVQGPPSRFPFDSSLPPLGPIPTLGPNVPLFPASRAVFGRSRPGRPSFRRGAFFPYAYPAFAGGYTYGYSPPSNVIIVQAAPARPEPAAPPPPREPVRPDIREYEWPSSTEASLVEQEPATFSIALEDGTVHSAEAAWVQNGMLHFVSSGGVHREVSLNLVDRSLTEKLNRQKKIRFRIPATGAG